MVKIITLTLFVLVGPALADHPPLYQEAAQPAGATPGVPEAQPAASQCPDGYEPKTSFGRPIAIVQAGNVWRRWQDFCKRLDDHPAYQAMGAMASGGVGTGARIGRLMKIARTSANGAERTAAAVHAVEIIATRNLAREVQAVCTGVGCESAARGLGRVRVATRTDAAQRVAVAVSHCVGGSGAEGCGSVVVSTAAAVGNSAPRVVTQVERVIGGRSLVGQSHGVLPGAVRTSAGEMARDALTGNSSTGFTRSALRSVGQ